MNREPERLNDLITESGAEKLGTEFDEFAGSTVISVEEQDRILSSVMRKAGFEMNETMTVKKTRRHGRRFIGLAIAAAVLGAGAIGAGAYAGRNILGRFVSDRYGDDIDQSKAVENLQSVTKDFEGVVLENTFEGLDFTYEGIVNDGTEANMMLTVSRSDGEPFVLEEYGELISPCPRISARVTDGNYEDAELFPYQSYSVSAGDADINPDGSITFCIPISDYAMFYLDNEEFWDHLNDPDQLNNINGEFVLSFTNLYLIPDEKSYDELMSGEMNELMTAPENYYLDGEYEKSRQAVERTFELYKQSASESYEGTLTFTVNTEDDHSLHAQTAEGDTTIDVSISSLSVKAEVSNEKGYEVQDWEVYEKTDGQGSQNRDIPIEVYLRDGTRYLPYPDWGSSCFDQGFTNESVLDEHGLPITTKAWLYADFREPMDVNDIDYVIVDGYKVEF